MVSATRGESNRGQANINLRGSCGRCGQVSRPWGAIARRPTIRPPGDYHSSNSAFVEKLTVTFNARSISALEILEQTDLHNQVPSDRLRRALQHDGKGPADGLVRRRAGHVPERRRDRGDPAAHQPVLGLPVQRAGGRLPPGNGIDHRSVRMAVVVQQMVDGRRPA